MRSDLEMIGALFEATISYTIKNMFQNIYVINGKTLKCKYLRRGVTQVDLIVVTDNSIFCIEAKRWRKYIKGEIEDYEWVALSNKPQCMFVTNPILQNLTHIRMIKSEAIKKGIKLPHVHNIICVPDECDIQTSCKEVMHLSELILFIQNDIKDKKSNKYNKELITSFIRKLGVDKNRNRNTDLRRR